LLNSLEDKWNPLIPQPEDYENIPREALQLDTKEVLFNPKITTEGTLSDAFRIFTNGLKGEAKPPDSRMEPERDEEQIRADHSLH
jgi:hypothetical protein